MGRAVQLRADLHPPPKNNLSCTNSEGPLPRIGRCRRRNGDGAPDLVNDVSRYSFLSTREGQKRWTPDFLCHSNSDAVTHPGFEYKVSSRWFAHSNLEKPRKYALPFIEHCGRISNSTQYYWKTKPSSIVATLIATVYKRLLTTMYRRIKFKAFKLQNLLLRCSAYYVFTKNDYFWNRLLAVLRLGRGAKSVARNLLFYFESKLDDSTRFVLRQAWSNQANWLKSRAERPRAQSKIGVICENPPRADYVDEICNHIIARSECNILRRIARKATVFWMM